jgi:hypothetical protein
MLFTIYRDRRSAVIVIPAQAEIHRYTTALLARRKNILPPWVPAFAGTTVK